MQCKDIDDYQILKYLKTHAPPGSFGITHWLIKEKKSVAYAMPLNINDKLRVAKMNMLLRRGLVEGCGCGCRGDWSITTKGVGFLENSENPS